MCKKNMCTLHIMPPCYFSQVVNKVAGCGSVGRLIVCQHTVVPDIVSYSAYAVRPSLVAITQKKTVCIVYQGANWE